MNNCDQNPCSEGLSSQESLASQLQNLIEALLGSFTKTIVNGRAVWGAQCSPNDEGISCFPRTEGEGWVCYMLRIIGEIGVFWEGVWDSATSYCQHSIVRYNGKIYVAISANDNKQPDLFPLIWEVFLEDGLSITGPPGTQGNPGSSGGGSAVNWAIRTTSSNTSLTNTDALVWCTNAGNIVITLPLMSTLLTGKWFKIYARGAGTVTLVSAAGDTFNGASSYIIDTQYAAVEVAAGGAADWGVA